MISVIIPVFNNEEFLVSCLASVKQQTYTDLEIICIDDGSTDKAGSIADEFAVCDDRFIIVHQQNHGESHARNKGLSIASGEYIAFVDCDDWLEPDMYECLMSAMKETDVQMSAAGWFRETNGESWEVRNSLDVKEGQFSRDDLLMYLYRRDDYRAFAYMWNKLYRRDLLTRADGSQIRFPEDLRLGGDVVFLAEIALNTRRAVFLDRPMYHYRQQNESGCHTKDLTKLREWVHAYEIVIALFEKERIDKNILDYTKRFLAYHASNAAREAMIQGNMEKLREFQCFMRKYKKEYVDLNMDQPERIQRFEELLDA